MLCLRTCAAHAAILIASILGTVVSGVAAGFLETDLVANKPELRDLNFGYRGLAESRGGGRYVTHEAVVPLPG